MTTKLKCDQDIDWDVTTWEGARREQLRRWSRLTLEQIVAAQEEMAEVAAQLSGTITSGGRYTARIANKFAPTVKVRHCVKPRPWCGMMVSSRQSTVGTVSPETAS